MEDPKKIKLSGKVIFYSGPDDPKAEEFGTSITLALDNKNQEAIKEFCKTNNVGKNSDPNRGTANLKTYTNDKTGETTIQYTVKFNDHTQFGGLNGLGQNDIGYGAEVYLIAKAYEYNKFGGGTAISATAVFVTKAAANNNDADLAELMSDLGDAAEETDVPF